MHGCGYHGRKYWTREEKLEWLKGYQKDLEQEAKGVKERVKELEKAS